MPILEPLPEAVRATFASASGGQAVPKLAVYSDIDGCGAFGIQWLVATSQHVFVFAQNGASVRLMRRIDLARVSEVNAEFLVGHGVLEAIVDGEVVDLLHYTHSLARKFNKVARALQSIVSAEDIQVNDEGEDRRCTICGRLYPDGSQICPACVNKARVLRRLIGLTRPYYRKLCAVAALMLLATTINLALPYLNKPFYNNLFQPERPSIPWWIHFPGLNTPGQILLTLVLAYVGIWTLSWVTAICQGRLSAWLGGRLTLDVRIQLYQTLQRLSLSYFDKRQLGGIMARVTQDTNALNNFMNQSLNSYLVSSLQIIGAVILMFAMSWKLTIWVLAPSPVVALLSILFFRRLIRKHHRYWHIWSRVAAILHDALAGLRVIRAFAQEDQEIARFNKKTNALYEAEVRLHFASNTFWPTISLFTQLSTAMIWLVGGFGVLSDPHANDPGTLVAFLAFISMFYANLQMICRSTDFMSSSLTATERIFEVLDTRVEVDENPNAIPLASMNGEVELRDVTFGYDPTTPVLKDVSLRVAPGEMIGLIGPSGAGKTTIINLVCRFYDVNEGAVLVDGIDVRNIRINDFRRQIGVVLQDPFLFSGTIFENIAYARPDATR